MSNIAETIDYKGYTVEIHYDESPSNPRDESDCIVSVLTQLSDRYDQAGRQSQRTLIVSSTRSNSYTGIRHNQRLRSAAYLGAVSRAMAGMTRAAALESSATSRATSRRRINGCR